MIGRLILYLTLLSISATAQSNGEQFFFLNQNIDQEIVYDQIEDVLIDSDGFTWIATTTGLYMYDGYEYSHFTHSNDSNSISENFITTLFEDSQGDIWAGSYNNGINVFDKKKKAFRKYKKSDIEGAGLSSNKIPRKENVILEDNDAKVWIHFVNEINIIDPVTGVIESIPSRTLDGQLMKSNIEDVFFVYGEGLRRLRLKDKSWELIQTEFKEVYEMINAESGYWLYTDKGIFWFDETEMLFSHLSELLNNEAQKIYIADIGVSAMYLDVNMSLWFAIEEKIFVFSHKDQNLEVIAYEEGVVNGVLDEKINGIYGDRKGNILVTYRSRGLTKVKININNFKHITQNKKGENAIIGSNMRSIFKDKEQNLWLGTYNYGINRFRENGDLSRIVHDPNDTTSISSNFITSIFVDSDQRLWVGTFEDGFNFSDLQTDQLEMNFVRSNSGEKMEIHEFTQISKNEIWISTDAGFVVFDKLGNSYHLYGSKKGEVKGLEKINIQAVLNIGDDIWFVSWNKGVGKLSLSGLNGSQDSLTLYDDIKDELGEPLENTFINICKDNELIWLASSTNGLVKMMINDGEVAFKKYDEESGAPSNTIYGIVRDEKGYLWMSSPNGLGKFDPIKEQFYNFYQTDGLTSNTFIWDSYYQSSDGEIMFGSVNGVTSFYPQNIVEDERKPVPYIKEIIINHESIQVGQELNGRILLQDDIRFTNSIALLHKELNFSLEYGALATSNTDQVKFSYMLEGFDQNWVMGHDNNRLVTYTNLKPGGYTFKIRATNNIGKWHDPGVLLKLTILPPWWRTIKAYIAYFLLIVLLVYITRKELENRAMLKHKLDLEEYKHVKNNELNREKFRFFTNMSHELRTPLTLILGPVNRMVRADDFSTRNRQNLELIQSQAHRLQKLINKLMDFRKYEVDNLKLSASRQSLNQFIDEIFIAFGEHAKSKNIVFLKELPERDVEFYFDTDKLEIILVNLLSNAFKFTPANGKVSVVVSSERHEKVKFEIENQERNVTAVYGEIDDAIQNYVRIRLNDTGVGIDADKIENVFERYFRASNLQTISIGGTGIGLEITKNYVVLHKGIIKVSSTVGKGTNFDVWLPLDADHLTKDQMVEVNSNVLDQTFESDELKDYSTYLTEVEKKEVNDNQPTILIVDDNPEIIFFLSENFNKGFNVLTAQNGQEALEQAFQNIPDILISDVMMPGLNGLELCRQLKSDIRTSHIPVVLLSARTAHVFQVEGLETGADDYITKPFDERMLNIKVRNLIQSRRTLRKRYAKEVTLMPKDIAINQGDESFLDQVIELVESNITNENLKVEWLAKEMGMSHSVLYKKVQALTDLSVVEFVRSIKLKKAAILLSQTSDAVNVISTSVGFSDAKYFSKSFQNYFGDTPSSFRKKNN